jgi:selenocysteine lyase/cysteine desulfurase
MPVAELARVAHDHGALIAVDTIQKAGAMPVDLSAEGVDFAYGGGHKWLLGTDGAGWLYVSKSARAELSDAMIGWLSMEDPVDFLFEPGRLGRPRRAVEQPRAQEGGSSSSAAVFALLEGVRLCREADPARTFAWTQRLHDAVEPRLLELGFGSERAERPELRSATLSLRPPSGVSLRRLQAALLARGVVLTTPDGRLRLAPHFFSTMAEAELLLDAMPAALAEATELG